MTTLTAYKPFNATTLATAVSLADHGTLHIVPPNEVQLTITGYRADIFGTLNIFHPTQSVVTSVHVYDTSPSVVQLFKLTNFSVTIGQIEAISSVSDFTSLFFGHADTFKGSSGADVFNGFGGNDRFIGAGGNDTMNGGPGNDTFAFRAGFGHDHIKAFNLGTLANHDTIELHSIGGLGNFTQVKNHASDLSGHVVITADSGASISLDNVAHKSQLHSFDFHFLV